MQCFHSTAADLSSCHRDQMTHKPKIFTFQFFEKKFADPTLGRPLLDVQQLSGSLVWGSLTWDGSSLSYVVPHFPGGQPGIIYMMMSGFQKVAREGKPQYASILKSLLASRFSVVPLVKVNPMAKPESVRGTTQDLVLKKGIIMADLENSPHTGRFSPRCQLSMWQILSTLLQN